MGVVEVKFDNNVKDGFYRFERFNLKRNLTVIVNSDRGLQFGKIKKILTSKEEKQLDGVDLYDVVRIASKRDYLKHINNINSIDEVVKKCSEIVKKSGISMTILDGSYNFDKSQLLFRFVADERVDFRQLAKELGSVFRTRIELRQIGIRDKAKEIGGIGPCGRFLCCSSFLNTFDSVTISMAKNQGVSLNPTKINGVCGRLLCCLRYENDIYSDLKKGMPRAGSIVNYHGKDGKVVSVNVLANTYKIQFYDKSIVEVDCYD